MMTGDEFSASLEAQKIINPHAFEGECGVSNAATTSILLGEKQLGDTVKVQNRLNRATQLLSSLVTLRPSSFEPHHLEHEYAAASEVPAVNIAVSFIDAKYYQRSIHLSHYNETPSILSLAVDVPEGDIIDRIEISLPVDFGLSVDGEIPRQGIVSLESEDLKRQFILFSPPAQTLSVSLAFSITVSRKTGVQYTLPPRSFPFIVSEQISPPETVAVAVTIDESFESATWGSMVDVSVSQYFSCYQCVDKHYYLLVEALPGWRCRNADGIVHDDYHSKEGRYYFYTEIDPDFLKSHDGVAAFMFKLVVPWDDAVEHDIFNPKVRPYVLLHTGGFSASLGWIDYAKAVYIPGIGAPLVSALTQRDDDVLRIPRYAHVTYQQPTLIDFNVEGEQGARNLKNKGLFSDAPSHVPNEDTAAVFAFIADVKSEADTLARLGQVLDAVEGKNV